jgi:hypothetical protein
MGDHVASWWRCPEVVEKCRLPVVGEEKAHDENDARDWGIGRGR